MKLPFTDDESEAANDAWGANCGPHALAAALMLPLDQVRPLFAQFEEKFRERGYGFTNPTMMGNALALARVPVKLTKGLRTQDILEDGIYRIQWEGKWLKPGVPPIVAYGHTHWIAATPTHVFCTAIPLFEFGCDFVWVDHEVWKNLIRVLCVRENFDGWHITHHYGFPVRAKDAA